MKEVVNITAEQKNLVQSSFQLLLPFWEEAAALFYKRLFELDPALRPLFKISISEQERKFMDMLRLAVYGLDFPDQLIPAIRRLGERHSLYGVKAEDYVTVGAALIWMLEQGLEESFSPDMKAAWVATYSLFSDQMVS